MLKGSTFLSTSGFTLAPNLIATVFSLHDSGTFSNDSLTRNWREQIGHVQITNSVISLTITVTASPIGGAEYYRRGDRSGDDGAERQRDDAHHLERRK